MSGAKSRALPPPRRPDARPRRLRLLVRAAALGPTLLTPLVSPSEAGALRATCPPGHERLADGTCRLVTLYDFYASPEGHGGVRAPLTKPDARYTPQAIDLGRLLFFDPILSRGKDLACASCHQPQRSLSDGRARALGASGSKGPAHLRRSTPTLWNVAFQSRFMWDGRADGLESQALLPLFAKEEMGHTREGLERALRAIPAYVQLFDECFGEPPSVDLVAHALAAFQSTLVSFNSRYDRYAHGDASALSPQEVRGYNAFRGFVGRCSQCHIPPLFTDSELSVVGAPADDEGYADPGAGALQDDPARLGAFKVPTLRNITRTGPYFHAGQFRDLEAVVGFYNETRGHMAPEGQDLRIHWHVHMTDGPQLSPSDVEDIVAFLGALEDETHLPDIPAHVPSGLRVVTGREDERGALRP